MNVRISYTVDIEELPDRINCLIKECAKDLAELTKYQIPLIKEDSCISAINEIDKLRKAMLKLDTKLGDAYGIIAGYNRTIAETKIVTNPERDSNEHDGS